MRFGSVCSGIEAASVAWHPLGWKAAWFSEIEPFPSAVLAHHYPDTPNLGDMTALPERILSGEVEAPDVFCGGTPCQAFSVAGLRQSLGDARGNLSLTFCEIANAIDTVRHVRGEQPSIVFWENVPGVLSTSDNAFGCFLAQLCGGGEPLVAPNGWTNAGCVSGPKRTVAWRVLDAQYFGVAQRRRRVFVVASARNDFDPAAVLFEFDSLRRDSAPSRQAREGLAGGIEIGPSGGRLTDLNPTLDTRAKDGPVRNQLVGAVMQSVSQVCPTLRAGGNQTGGDRPPGTDVDTADSLIAITQFGETAGTLTARHDSSPCADRGMDVVAFAIQAGALRTNPDSGPDGVGIQADHAYTLEARAEVQCVAQPIAFHPTQDPISSTDGTTHGLGCGSGGGQASVAVAQPMSWTTKLHNTQSNNAGKIFEERSPCLDANNPAPALLTAMAVRRLTPVECERLQGFPDNHTNIPWSAAKEAARKGISYEAILALRGMTLRGPNLEDCPDGPRYKALGNSWAVPNVRWIGERIASALR